MPVLLKSVLFVLLPLAVLTTHAQQQRSDTLIFHFAFDRSEVKSIDAKTIGQYFQDKVSTFACVDSPEMIIEGSYVDSVYVIGYTDKVGGSLYNQRLSIHRAEAISKLITRWLPEEFANKKVEGRGKSDLLPGDDSLSRRAVVIVYYHDKPAPPVSKIETPPAHADNEPDTVISLNNINFIANTPVLTDAAREAMPRTIDNLRSFSDRYLEIDGFCNAPGPPLPPHDPLFKLSVQRAKYIYDMLVNSGFDSTRLRYKGLGNTRPVNAHPTTAAEMDQNMRVEIKVFSKLPPS